jgi:hypothetical protein
MAIVSGIPIENWQVEELGKVDFPNELHLVEEPDGSWTVDNGNAIIFEFVPACSVCGGPVTYCDCAGEGTV